jgi:Na+/proline symporter
MATSQLGGTVLAIVSGGELSEAAGTVVVALLSTSYTVLAGMLSVVYTDVVNSNVRDAARGWAVGETAVVLFLCLSL